MSWSRGSLLGLHPDSGPTAPETPTMGGSGGRTSAVHNKSVMMPLLGEVGQRFLTWAFCSPDPRVTADPRVSAGVGHDHQLQQ